MPRVFVVVKKQTSIIPKRETFHCLPEKLVQEGYEVEAFAKKLFSDGIDLPEHASPMETKRALQDDYAAYFQPSFITKKDTFARIDILERLSDGTLHIYEVKSSTSIKTDRKHRQVDDACFQKYVLTECGYKVSKISIIHLNKEYVRQGEIIPEELLEVTEVTHEVDNIYSSLVNQINAAVNFLKKEKIDETKCSCIYKTRSNHCDAFKYFNNSVPDFSIYEIGRISAKKVRLLVDNGQLAMIDIPKDFELNENQQSQLDSLIQGRPLVNEDNINRELGQLKFPLHFIDYETYASAIPKLDGLSPHKHLPFQVSIHTLNKDGTLNHFEYLLEAMQMPEDMLQTMQNFTGSKGTFISWHASFEIGRNKDLIEWLPQFDELSYIYQ